MFWNKQQENIDAADKKLFQEGFRPRELQEILRKHNQTEQARRRAHLGASVASLMKRCVNERIALEEMLTEQGMKEFSLALYSFDWKRMSDDLVRRRKSYWRNLWAAIIGR